MCVNFQLPIPNFQFARTRCLSDTLEVGCGGWELTIARASAAPLVPALTLVLQQQLRGVGLRRQFRRQEEHGAILGEGNLHRQYASHRSAAGAR